MAGWNLPRTKTKNKPKSFKLPKIKKIQQKNEEEKMEGKSKKTENKVDICKVIKGLYEKKKK